MPDSWVHFPAGFDGPDRVRRRLVFAGLAVLSVFAIGVLGYWLIGGGNWSWSDCAYMVLITITTVGYGEVLPVSDMPGGRLFTAGLMVSGLGLSLYFMSSLTAFIIEGDLQQALWRRRMRRKLDALRDHVIVCGAGETGRNVVEELLGAGLQVVVIEQAPERLDVLHRQLEGAVIGITADATEDAALLNAGIRFARGVITTLHSDRDNLFVTVTARQINPNVRIVSRAVHERSATKLLRAGADAIVSPNLIGGQRMAHEMVHPKVVGFMDLLIRDNEGTALSVSECRLRAGSRLHGVKLMDSGVRGCGVLILSVLAPDGETHTFNPAPDFELREGMTLIAMGTREAAHALDAHVNG
jgi:voltage-gated potassium channel